VCLDLTPLLTTSRQRGIGSYLRSLARTLCQSPGLLDGIELSFLAGPPLGMRVRPASSDLVSDGAPWTRGRLLPDLLYFALKRTLARRQLMVARLDLFHATWAKGTPAPTGLTVVATCHDLIPVVLGYPFQPPLLPTRARAAVECRRYRQFQGVIAVSHHTRGDLLRITGLPEDRVRVVHSGIDHERFQPTPRVDERRSVGSLLGTDRPYFLYLGGFDSRKNVPQLVEAFCARRGDFEEALVLGGGITTAQRSALDARVRALGAQGRVLLPGHLDPVILPALYRGATAHTQLSCYEGFGLTVTEALACGCPVVALRSSSLPEIAGEAALWVDLPSAQAIGDALVRVAHDRELRRQLAERGLRRAALFSWERCAAETVAVYRSLLEGRTIGELAGDPAGRAMKL
jgi:glycosyltransferase involved in cell wall biosynthesis